LAEGGNADGLAGSAACADEEARVAAALAAAAPEANTPPKKPRLANGTSVDRDSGECPCCFGSVIFVLLK
jgi:hypothetical protein